MGGASKELQDVTQNGVQQIGSKYWKNGKDGCPVRGGYTCAKSVQCYWWNQEKEECRMQSTDDSLKDIYNKQTDIVDKLQDILEAIQNQ